MFIGSLLQNPIIALIWLAVILISLTVHEFSHALVGKLRGDRTAEAEGRLTLNPLAHIDWMGFLPLVLLGFGWAKPVPFNPYNLKDPKWDAVKIALAGPFSNLLLAILAGGLYRGLILTDIVSASSALATFLYLLVLINLFLMFFNLIPVHPLDGSKLVDAFLYKPQHMRLRYLLTHYGPQVLMFAVLLSLFTSMNVFSFMSIPSFAICEVLIGAACY